MKRLGLVLVVVAAVAVLDPGLPRVGSVEVALDFLAAALQPTLLSGAGESLLPVVTDALVATVAFAACAMSVAVAFGGLLGALSSTRVMGRAAWPFRLLASGLRSVHELVWAMLLLAALGLSNSVAVLALALPATGVLAKVFSELFEEAPSGAERALVDAGAGRFQALALGVFPRAAPDLGAYAFYRFECALRSAAVLGFFGFPTLGLRIQQSADNLLFGEVWLYLYALIGLVAATELWSAVLRRRLRVR